MNLPPRCASVLFLGRVGGLLAVLWFAAMARADDTRAPIEWTLKFGRSNGDSTPAIGTNNTIYFGTFNEGLWAVDAEGNRKWRFEVLSEIWASPAVSGDGTVYFGCRDRRLYALTPRGGLRWTFETGGWVDSSVAIGTNGNVYFGSWDGKFYALNEHGQKLWEFKTAGPVVSSPAIDREGMIYFGSHDGNFYALTAEGKKAWEFKTTAPVISSPALTGEGRIYFTSLDGYLYALARDGSLIWKLKIVSYLGGSPVVGMAGKVYVPGNNEGCAITGDGKFFWRRGSDPVLAPITVAADGSALVFYESGVIVACDNKMNTVWYNHISGGTHAAPTILPTGMVLLIGSGGSELVALKGSAPLAQTSWPKFRGNLRNTGNLAD